MQKLEMIIRTKDVELVVMGGEGYGAGGDYKVVEAADEGFEMEQKL